MPELPGCAADGVTHQDAVANAEVVIREWIETAQELGRPIARPKAGWFSHSPAVGRKACSMSKLSLTPKAQALGPVARVQYVGTMHGKAEDWLTVEMTSDRDPPPQ